MVRKIDKNPGFGLIEIMMVVAIFGIGVLGLAGMVPMGTRGPGRSTGSTIAHVLAQAKLQELENASGDSSLSAATAADTLRDGRYIRRWTVTENAPLRGMTTIQVEVQWKDEEGSQRVELSTSLQVATR
jgi:prepilin-type N-terminal cleavage/methylation domain-containing protein